MPYFRKEFSTGTEDANGEPDLSASQTSAIVSILSAGKLVVMTAARQQQLTVRNRYLFRCTHSRSFCR